jgi:hypothetical protein
MALNVSDLFKLMVYQTIQIVKQLVAQSLLVKCLSIAQALIQLVARIQERVG